MKKQNLNIFLLLFISIILNSCSKNEDKGICSDGIQNQTENGVDCGGPCAACPTCSDGIQNQNETGVDCGGACPACNVICLGNGENSWMPMKQNNAWKYGSGSDTTSDYQYLIHGTKVFNAITYFKFQWDDYFSSPVYTYYRSDAAGNIYEYSEPYNAEFLYVPASPAAGQTWLTGGGDTMKAVSIAATVTTPACNYLDCLQIDRINGSTGAVIDKFYFKKGIGMVRKWYLADDNLVGIVLN